ncbi:MAG: ATP-grasp domain-containing protein [Gammaproteobacteria bacterium]|nr:ATP-grasp domain-containing protein [Gammaproteobacteria bacterium]NIR84055.1 ATP-grasp domain-containing protein [Gammaproteobacteria bacterium]NIR89199.1 ATP-grasp domain-containing protein [Gammaproteobacteria bacterium]NIU05001.1 ATP-grasp domain-containing protein [Gammaproteobacteria bacterium]NIV52167.1 ATP-grasp domain-containing protein [Gammaproteobacteria bacterium]
MRKLRVLVVVPEGQMAPDDAAELSEKQFEQIKAAYDVLAAVERLGHEARQLGLSDEVGSLRRALEDWKPSIVFNLVDQFRGLTIYDQHIVSYLQLLGIPYTGCNPRGLVIASDKALSKKILHYHRIRAPRFASFPRGRRVQRPKRLEYPLIVKADTEEASFGIARASVVHSDEQLVERVRFVHESFHTAAIAEQYIDGRELYVGVVGNQRLQILPVWELHMDGLPADAPRIATFRVKWDLSYQDRYKLRIGRARKLPDEVATRLDVTTRRVYKALNLSGYARIDYRLASDDRLYFIEANANPDISRDEELACAARAADLGYEALIQKVLNLGLRWADTF